MGIGTGGIGQGLGGGWMKRVLVETTGIGGIW